MHHELHRCACLHHSGCSHLFPQQHAQRGHHRVGRGDHLPCGRSIIGNLIIDPLFYGMPFDAVAGLVLPAILPFNVIKGVLLSILTLLIYKAISNLITPAKNQKQARPQA